MTTFVCYVPDEVIEENAQFLLAEIARFECRIPGAEFTESDDQVLDGFAKPFAKKFLVSPIAMRIRLEKLGLASRRARSAVA
ncbi:MAG TPA: hypothetical protein VIL70_10190 [Chthoniobacterales bacterium]